MQQDITNSPSPSVNTKYSNSKNQNSQNVQSQTQNSKSNNTRQSSNVCHKQNSILSPSVSSNNNNNIQQHTHIQSPSITKFPKLSSTPNPTCVVKPNLINNINNNISCSASKVNPANNNNISSLSQSSNWSLNKQFSNFNFGLNLNSLTPQQQNNQVNLNSFRNTV